MCLRRSGAPRYKNAVQYWVRGYAKEIVARLCQFIMPWRRPIKACSAGVIDSRLRAMQIPGRASRHANPGDPRLAPRDMLFKADARTVGMTFFQGSIYQFLKRVRRPTFKDPRHALQSSDLAMRIVTTLSAGNELAAFEKVLGTHNGLSLLVLRRAMRPFFLRFPNQSLLFVTASDAIHNCPGSLAYLTANTWVDIGALVAGETPTNAVAEHFASRGGCAPSLLRQARVEQG